MQNNPLYREDIVRILYKVAEKQEISIEEGKVLDEWLDQSDYNRALYDEVSDIKAMEEEVRNMVSYDSRALWKKIRARMPRKKNSVIGMFRHHTLKYVAAAVLLILISTTVYIFFVKPTSYQNEPVSETKPATDPDILPGNEKAILTLDDGTALVLDNTSNGQIAQEGTTTIMKEDGLLAYNPTTGGITGKTYYNTIATPRAGYYSSLVLADGSKVWLDALSSIRFPTAFMGKERVVEITGQVYFEVAKNASKPFKVQVKDKGIAVEVLGTHFNINAYNDEATVSTTLLEGAVKVVSANGKHIHFLKPGQQAKTANNGETKTSSDIDIESIMAWKNGQFLYNKESMTTIMREVSRWYGVEVVFEDKIQGQFVVNPLPRNVPVSKLLKILSHTKEVEFDIRESDKKIIVRHYPG